MNADVGDIGNFGPSELHDLARAAPLDDDPRQSGPGPVGGHDARPELDGAGAIRPGEDVGARCGRAAFESRGAAGATACP
eukprot:2666601-Prymnesium_polylepis.1